jgi:quinol monooxygenase YgiN
VRFAGYVCHRLLEDDEVAGHFVVISEWNDRATADRIRDEYAGAESVKQLEPLLLAPRERRVFRDPE